MSTKQGPLNYDTLYTCHIYTETPNLTCPSCLKSRRNPGLILMNNDMAPIFSCCSRLQLDWLSKYRNNDVLVGKRAIVPSPSPRSPQLPHHPVTNELVPSSARDPRTRLLATFRMAIPPPTPEDERTGNQSEQGGGSFLDMGPAA